jgi:hypothetical protein
MAKVFSRKGIILIVIPLFTLFLQGFIRFILKSDFNTIGITLGSLGLGQLLPFFYFDHFVANKLLGISPEYKFENETLQVVYRVVPGVEIKQDKINALKNWYITVIFLNLALFLIIVYLGIIEKIAFHILLGALSCFLSWYLLIFKND